MKQLLGRHVEFLNLAVADWNLFALIVGDLLAVRSGLGGAVGGALDLTGEGLGHLSSSEGFGYIVPELLLVTAAHRGNDELHVLLDEFALLPGDRLALVRPRPDLTTTLKQQSH